LDTAIHTPRFNEISLFWAIVGSMLLHTLVVVVVPNFNFSAVKEKRQLIKVELLQPPPPPPPVIEELPPVEIPQPPKPKPPEPVKKKVKPVVKPKPIKKEAPKPIEPIVEPPVEIEPPPVVEEVIAVQPTVDNPPEFIAPEPTPAPIEPPPPPQPTQAERDNALDAYSNQLGRAIAKHKSYPKIAQRRGWQGTVILAIKVDGNGQVLSASVSKSSGHNALDKQALKMVEKASPFPTPPSALRGDDFTISVPVAFKLAER